MNNKVNESVGFVGVVLLLFVMIMLCISAYSLNANSTPQPTATPKPVVIINDQAVTVDETNFSIACDTAKELGIVYFIKTVDYGTGEYAYSPSGILTGKDYERLCGAAK